MEVDLLAMTCGHCVNTIKTAILEIAPDAVVSVDLKAGKVSVENGPDRGAVEQAISQAGFKTT